MDLRWEIDRVSTPERIFDKIKTEMAQPVGIVVVGVDCELKTMVVNLMIRKLGNDAHHYIRSPISSLDNFTDMSADHYVVTATLDTISSAMYDMRCELINSMRRAGVKTVVEVYAKARKLPLWRCLFSLKAIRHNLAIIAIEACKPTADEADYFIPVTSKEG